jgi:tol-pal system protein YbgF
VDSSGSTAADTTEGSEVRAAYDAARLDLTRGNFDLAATGFREFVRLYPTSELADNAQYWLGEAYYAQDQHIEAIAEFALVAEEYPGGDKVPAALLKMGYSHIALGEKAEGISLLKRVTSEFPRTPEAQQAQERLRELAAGRGE